MLRTGKHSPSQVDVPILTGKDIYLKEPFEVLCQEHAREHCLLSRGGNLKHLECGNGQPQERCGRGKACVTAHTVPHINRSASHNNPDAKARSKYPPGKAGGFRR